MFLKDNPKVKTKVNGDQLMSHAVSIVYAIAQSLQYIIQVIKG